jgi:hypothetical protein
MPSLVELFVDGLDGELASRKRELTDLYGMARTAASPRSDALARSCQVMAYAHWEGFCKRAFRLYVEHIEARRVTLDALHDELQFFALASRLKQAAADSSDLAARRALWAAIDARDTTRFAAGSTDWWHFGNLDSSTLRHFLELLALDYLPQYALRERFIDQVLCGRRHRIAHGELEPIDIKELGGTIADVTMLCDILNNQVQEAALYETFRRP